MVGHVAPEAAMGGPIAAIMDGDVITIDALSGNLKVDIDDDDLRIRMDDWTPVESKYKWGVLAKYGSLVSSASLGAICIPGGPHRNERT